MYPVLNINFILKLNFMTAERQMLSHIHNTANMHTSSGTCYHDVSVLFLYCRSCVERTMLSHRLIFTKYMRRGTILLHMLFDINSIADQ